MFITRYSLPITIYFGVKIRWRVNAKRQDLAHKAPIECKMREMTTIGRIFKSHKSNLTLAHLTNKKKYIFFNHKIFLGYGLFKAWKYMVVKFEHSEQTFFVDKQISNYRSIEPWNIFYIFDQRESIRNY